TITLVDQYQNVETAFSGTKTLTFAGLSTALNGTIPTVTNNSGSPVNEGGATTITFTNGVSTLGGSLVAYKAESATLSATDGSLSTASARGAGASLIVPPPAASAYRISAATTTPTAGVADVLTIALVDQ